MRRDDFKISDIKDYADIAGNEYEFNDDSQVNPKGTNLEVELRFYLKEQMRGIYIAPNLTFKKTSWELPNLNDPEEDIEVNIQTTAYNLKLGWQAMINKTLWSDLFVGYGVRNIQHETAPFVSKKDQTYFYNTLIGWKLGFRF